MIIAAEIPCVVCGRSCAMLNVLTVMRQWTTATACCVDDLGMSLSQTFVTPLMQAARRARVDDGRDEAFSESSAAFDFVRGILARDRSLSEQLLVPHLDQGPLRAEDALRSLCTSVVSNGVSVSPASRDNLDQIVQRLMSYMTQEQKDVAISLGLIDPLRHFVGSVLAVDRGRMSGIRFTYETEDDIRNDSCMSSVPRMRHSHPISSFGSSGVTLPILSHELTIRGLLFPHPPKSVSDAMRHIQSCNSPHARTPNTVMCPRMGSADGVDLCATCGFTREGGCPGHVGHIDMPFPLFNPFTLSTVCSIMKCVCTWCHRLMADTLWSSAERIVQQLDAIASLPVTEDTIGRVYEQRRALRELVLRADAKTDLIVQAHEDYQSHRDAGKLRSRVVSILLESGKGGSEDRTCPHCGMVQFQWAKSTRGTYLEAVVSAAGKEYIEQSIHDADKSSDLVSTLEQTVVHARETASKLRSEARKRTSADVVSSAYIARSAHLDKDLKKAEALVDDHKGAYQVGEFHAGVDDRAVAMSAEIAYQCLRKIDVVTMAVMGYGIDPDQGLSVASVRRVFGDSAADQCLSETDSPSVGPHTYSVVRSVDRIRGILGRVVDMLGEEHATDDRKHAARGLIAPLSAELSTLVSADLELRRADAPVSHLGRLMFKAVPVMPYPLRASTERGTSKLSVLYNELVRVRATFLAVYEARHRPNNGEASVYRKVYVDCIDKLWNHAQTCLCMLFDPPKFGAGIEDLSSEKGVCGELSGKEQGPRGHVLGMRMNYSATAVFTLANHLPPGWVLIPDDLASRMPYIEHVTVHNLDWIVSVIRSQLSKVHTSWTVMSVLSAHRDAEGCIKYVRMDPASATVRVGDRIERTICDGDVILINRPPSLHGGSFVAVRVKRGTDTNSTHDQSAVSGIRRYTVAVADNACEPMNMDFDGDAAGIKMIPSQEDRIEARVLMDSGRIMIQPAKSRAVTGLSMQDGTWGAFDLTNRSTLRPDTFDSLMMTGSAPVFNGSFREVGLFRADAGASPEEICASSMVDGLVTEGIRIAMSRRGGVPSVALAKILSTWEHEPVLRRLLFLSRMAVYSEGRSKGYDSAGCRELRKCATYRHLALTQVAQRLERERLCAASLRTADRIALSDRLRRSINELDACTVHSQIPLSLIASVVCLVRRLKYSRAVHTTNVFKPDDATLLSGTDGVAFVADLRRDVLGGTKTPAQAYEEAELFANQRHSTAMDIVHELSVRSRGQYAHRIKHVEPTDGERVPIPLEPEPVEPRSPHVEFNLSRCDWSAYVEDLRARCTAGHATPPLTCETDVQCLFSSFSGIVSVDDDSRVDVHAAVANAITSCVSATASFEDIDDTGNIISYELSGVPLVWDRAFHWKPTEADTRIITEEVNAKVDAYEAAVQSTDDVDTTRVQEMFLRDALHRRSVEAHMPYIRQYRLTWRETIRSELASSLSLACRPDDCLPMPTYLTRFDTESWSRGPGRVHWVFGIPSIDGDAAIRRRAFANPFVFERLRAARERNVRSLQDWSASVIVRLAYVSRVCAWAAGIQDEKLCEALRTSPNIVAAGGLSVAETFRRYVDPTCQFSESEIESVVRPFLTACVPSILAYHRQQSLIRRGEITTALSEEYDALVSSKLQGASPSEVSHYSAVLSSEAHLAFQETYTGSVVVSNLMPYIDDERTVRRSVASDPFPVHVVGARNASILRMYRTSESVDHRRRFFADLWASDYTKLPAWHPAIILSTKERETVANRLSTALRATFEEGRRRCIERIRRMDENKLHPLESPVACLSDYFKRSDARKRLIEWVQSARANGHTQLQSAHIEVASLSDYGDLFIREDIDAEDAELLHALREANLLDQWDTGRYIRRRMMRGHDKEYNIFCGGVLHAGVVDGSITGSGNTELLFRVAMQYGEVRASLLLSTLSKTVYRWSDLCTASVSLSDFLVPPQALSPELRKWYVSPGTRGFEASRRQMFAMARQEKERILQWFDTLSAMARSGDAARIAKVHKHLGEYKPQGYSAHMKNLPAYLDALLLRLMTTLREYWAEVFVAVVGGTYSRRDASSAILMMGDKTGGAGSKGNKVTLAKIVHTFGNLMVGGVGMRSADVDSRVSSHFGFGETSAEASGAVYNNFITGFSYREMRLYADTAKDGCMHKVLSVAKAGETSRGLHFACQDFTIHADNTLRDASGRVMMQRFADTGDDPSRVHHVKSVHAVSWDDFCEQWGITRSDGERVRAFDDALSGRADRAYADRMQRFEPIVGRSSAILKQTGRVDSFMSHDFLRRGFTLASERECPVDVPFLVARAHHMSNLTERIDASMAAADQPYFAALESRDPEVFKKAKRAMLRYGMSRKERDEMADTAAGRHAIRVEFARREAQARGKPTGDNAAAPDGDVASQSAGLRPTVFDSLRSGGFAALGRHGPPRPVPGAGGATKEADESDEDDSPGQSAADERRGQPSGFETLDDSLRKWIVAASYVYHARGSRSVDEATRQNMLLEPQKRVNAYISIRFSSLVDSVRRQKKAVHTFDSVVSEMRRRAFDHLTNLDTYYGDWDNKSAAVAQSARLLSDEDCQRVAAVIRYKVEQRARVAYESYRNHSAELFTDAQEDEALRSMSDADAHTSDARLLTAVWRYLQDWGVRSGVGHNGKITTPVDVGRVLKTHKARTYIFGDAARPVTHCDIARLRRSVMNTIFKRPAHGVVPGGEGRYEPGVAEQHISSMCAAPAGSHADLAQGVFAGLGLSVARSEEDTLFSDDAVYARQSDLEACIAHPYHNPLFLCHLILSMNTTTCAGMSIGALEDACNEIVRIFFDTKVEPGTPMGLRMAYCLSEPVMQSMLDAFKSAGDGLDTEGREMRMRAALRVSPNADLQQLTIDLQPLVERMNDILAERGRDRVVLGPHMTSDVYADNERRSIFDALLSHHVSLLGITTLSEIVVSSTQHACSEKYRMHPSGKTALHLLGYESNGIDLLLRNAKFDFLHCGAARSFPDSDEEWVVRQLVPLGLGREISIPTNQRGLADEEKQSFASGWRTLYRAGSMNSLSVKAAAYACTDSLLRIVIDRQKMKRMHVYLGHIVSAIYHAPGARGMCQVLTNFDPSRTPAEQPTFVMRIRMFYRLDSSPMKHLLQADRDFVSIDNNVLGTLVAMDIRKRAGCLSGYGSLAGTGMLAYAPRDQRAAFSFHLNPAFATGVPIAEGVEVEARRRADLEVRSRTNARKAVAQMGGFQGDTRASEVMTILEIDDATQERIASMHKEMSKSCLYLAASNTTSSIVVRMMKSALKGCIRVGRWRMLVEEASRTEHYISDGDETYQGRTSVRTVTEYRLRQRISFGSIVGIDESPYVDVAYSRTHTPFDCNKRFGVVSMAKCAEKEMRDLVSSGGHYLSDAAVRLVSAFISWPGVPSPLNKDGLRHHKCPTLERASFDSTVGHFHAASSSDRREPLEGFVSAVYACGSSGCGTDSVHLVPCASA